MNKQETLVVDLENSMYACTEFGYFIMYNLNVYFEMKY